MLLRSAVATRLDSFTQDEGYHILAGVSYVKRADFRINPEHPPLVKLWVGAVVAVTGFNLSPFREMHDKSDERDFAEADVYVHNDPDSVQRRARAAMWALNAMLLAGLALALRRTFGPLTALAVLTVLAIDPTVAAHLPLVLTDLPVSLLVATAVVLAGRAFRTWAWPDLALTSLALGLALATKHSAPVFAILICVTGLAVICVAAKVSPTHTRPQKLAKLLVVMLGSIAILWAFYLFRFTESSGAAEVFNLPLAQKIGDLHSPVYRFVLDKFAALHLLPRAYIWGFADTIRAGIEGRVETRLFYGHVYLGRIPAYFFPGVLAVKLPLGLIFLIAAGLLLFVRRKLPREFNFPVLVMLIVTAGFFCVLTSTATYGGMRHALPAAVLLYLFAGVALSVMFTAQSRPFKVAAGIALAAAALSALPVPRPYEYYNEIIGTKNAYRYFNDEGIDAEQRGKELFNYYVANLKPTGEVPYFDYYVPQREMEARGMDWVGRDLDRDESRMSTPTITGTFFMGHWNFGKRPYWDVPFLRTTAPTERFGNLFVYRGTFSAPGLQAAHLYAAGLTKMYAGKPDPVAAEHLFRRSVQMDPGAYFIFIELGNIALARGSREEALSDYQDALRHVRTKVLAQPIEEQIRRLATTSLSQVPPLRNPDVE
jgi:hypothetical protein